MGARKVTEHLVCEYCANAQRNSDTPLGCVWCSYLDASIPNSTPFCHHFRGTSSLLSMLDGDMHQRVNLKECI